MSRFERFELPPDVLCQVKQYVREFDFYREKCKDVNIHLPLVDTLPSMDYSAVKVSHSNISNPTENLACARAEMQEDVLEARRIVNAIMLAIEQASSETRSPKNRLKVQDALKRSLLDGIARECLDMPPKTLWNYRKATYFYIAVNLKLLTV